MATNLVQNASDLLKQLDPLEKVSVQVTKDVQAQLSKYRTFAMSLADSWSKVPLGYLTDLYYGAYEKPPTTDEIDPMMGGHFPLVPNWKSRNLEDIYREVTRRAGFNIAQAEEHLGKLTEKAAALRTDLLVRFSVLHDLDGLTSEKNLLDDIEKFDFSGSKDFTAFLSHGLLSAIVSIDSKASAQGVKAPPHQNVAAHVYGLEKQCIAIREFLAVSRRLLRQIVERGQDVVVDAKGGPKAENNPMNSRDVFVIHGRDERLRSGMFQFLRSLDLNPIEWARAVELTGKAAPYVGEVLDAAFSSAQAVVVLLSPDDLVRLRPGLCGQLESSHETNFTHQARPNVLFEAGMAMARHPDRTVLVEIGALRPFSDIGGRHTIRMDNSPKKRQELAQRLQSAGCPVSLSGTDWQTAGDLNAPEQLTSSQTPAQEPRPQNSTATNQDLLADLISELEDNLECARAPRIGDAYARPSSQIWKSNRNRLTLPNHLRSELVNIYRQLDAWSTVVDSGVTPNMGSPAIDGTAAHLRNQLWSLIEELKKLLQKN
jgi:predicted nucleotide-binding protein